MLSPLAFGVTPKCCATNEILEALIFRLFFDTGRPVVNLDRAISKLKGHRMVWGQGLLVHQIQHLVLKYFRPDSLQIRQRCPCCFHSLRVQHLHRFQIQLLSLITKEDFGTRIEVLITGPAADYHHGIPFCISSIFEDGPADAPSLESLKS